MRAPRIAPARGRRSRFDPSFDEAALPQVVEDQLVKRKDVRGEDVSNSALSAPLLEASDEGIQSVLVSLQERCADGDLGALLILAVDQAKVPDKIGIDFFLGED